MVTGTGDGLAWAVVPAERPVLRSTGGVLLVHEVGSRGLSLLPVVAWRLLLATALAVVVAALAAWLLAGRLTAPLGRLVTAARRVGEGDLSTRVHVDGDGEIAEVASAFNDMAAGLERAQGEQRAFLASVGHELKTPLTTVQGYTEALLDGTVDDPAERRRSLVRVHTETIRLARLVQDLLDLARLGRGQFAVSSVDADVGAVLREAAAAAAEQATSRQVTVTTLPGVLRPRRPGPAPPGARQPARQRQPLQPVRPPGPGRGPPLDGGGVEAAIVDQGPGIAPEDLPTPSTAATCGPATAAPGRSGRASVWPSSRPCATPWGSPSAEPGHGGGTAFRLILPPPRATPANGRPLVGPAAQGSSPPAHRGERASGERRPGRNVVAWFCRISSAYAAVPGKLSQLLDRVSVRCARPMLVVCARSRSPASVPPRSPSRRCPIRRLRPARSASASTPSA